ncbi:MAG TPA: hypothetical protein VD861_04970 [Pyrinomonadaceae bacterium]|nr:hypothetical protein [Pyrinomonadaceae bacterium]
MKNRLQSRAISFSLVLALLVYTNAAADPIKIYTANPQYFDYNGRVMTLVGTSASYLCHVDQTDADDATNFCTWGNHNTFFTQLRDSGLNKIRLWLALNHSPGSHPTDSPGTSSNLELTPYESEQPFKWNSTTKKWNLDKWSEPTATENNGLFFPRVKQVIQDAQSKGIIVEVTLFDAFSGAFENSPWNDRNNAQDANHSLSDENYFTSFDSVTDDTHLGNKYVRTIQRNFVKKMVNLLNEFDNFYWEIANEPDNNNVDPRGTINWHQDMINQIKQAESLLPKKHLIAVNFSQTDSLNWASANTDISIINGHYVTISDHSTRARSGAIELISPWRPKPTSPALNPINKMLGFNEGRITNATQATADSVRAEAWEFMLSEGGAFDHLGYLNGSATSPFVDPAELRRQLGALAKFLNGEVVNGVLVPGISLANMTRHAFNPPFWAANLPKYGTQPTGTAYKVYWGSMQWSRNEYVLYVHHSLMTNAAFNKYNPVTGSYKYALTMNLGPQSGWFTAKWINPKTGALLTGANNQHTFYWPADGTTYTLPVSPTFSFDAVLHVKRQ